MMSIRLSHTNHELSSLSLCHVDTGDCNGVETEHDTRCLDKRDTHISTELLFRFEAAQAPFVAEREVFEP